MPVLEIPKPITITAIMAITALLEKPEITSKGFNIPDHPNVNIHRIATRSTRKTSKIKRIIVAINITITISC
jgi:hypothetical protein